MPEETHFEDSKVSSSDETEPTARGKRVKRVKLSKWQYFLPAILLWVLLLGGVSYLVGEDCKWPYSATEIEQLTKHFSQRYSEERIASMITGSSKMVPTCIITNVYVPFAFLGYHYLVKDSVRKPLAAVFICVLECTMSSVSTVGVFTIVADRFRPQNIDLFGIMSIWSVSLLYVPIQILSKIIIIKIFRVDYFAIVGYVPASNIAEKLV